MYPLCTSKKLVRIQADWKWNGLSEDLEWPWVGWMISQMTFLSTSIDSFCESCLNLSLICTTLCTEVGFHSVQKPCSINSFPYPQTGTVWWSLKLTRTPSYSALWLVSEIWTKHTLFAKFAPKCKMYHLFSCGRTSHNFAKTLLAQRSWRQDRNHFVGWDRIPKKRGNNKDVCWCTWAERLVWWPHSWRINACCDSTNHPGGQRNVKSAYFLTFVGETRWQDATTGKFSISSFNEIIKQQQIVMWCIQPLTLTNGQSPTDDESLLCWISNEILDLGFLSWRSLQK